MKKLKLLSLLFIALALNLGFTSCSKEEGDSTTDYSALIPGFWAVDISESELETLSINSKGQGSIIFYDTVDNDWGIMAFGTYTLNDNIITATYDRVSVKDENYKPTTWHGFTDGKAKTVKYTIVSCDGKDLVIKNENGETRNYEKYKDI